MYKFPSQFPILIERIFPTPSNQLALKLYDCDFSNPTTEVCKNHSFTMLSTLGRFLSTKHTEYSKLRSDLTVNSWAATISPACINRQGRIFTFSPLSFESIKIISSSDAIADDNDVDCMRRSYWNYMKAQLKIIDNRTVSEVSEKTVFIRGRIFVTNGNSGNIAHSIQHLTCNMAAAIGSKSGPFDGTINWEGRCAAVAWSIVTAIADAIALTQHPAPLARIDWLVPSGFMCFEHLSIQRPNACGPHELNRRPSNHNETLKIVRSVLFERQNLSRKSTSMSERTRSPCIKKVLIYSRNDTSRRKLLNAGTIQTSVAANKCLNVTLINSWPISASEQALMVNSVDAMIMPHGAAIYTSLFLPDAGWVIEIGSNTWIGMGLISVLPFSYHYISFGLDVSPEGSKIDSGRLAVPKDSFSVNQTTIDYIRSIVESHACECELK
jgi:hypothetical protein